LLQSRGKAFADIISRFDSTFAEEVIYSTYNSNHINRYFSEDCQIIFQDSGLNIEKYQITLPREPSPEIQAALESRYPGHKQFSNNGIYAILQKPETGLVTFLFVMPTLGKWINLESCTYPSVGKETV